MHILIVHQYFLHEKGGGGSRWNQFAKYWAARGHKITVIAGMLEIVSAKKYPEYKGKFIVKEKIGDNIEVFRCHVSESYNKNFIGRAWAYFSFVLSSLIAGFFVKKPDAMVCTSPPLTVGLTGIWLKRFKNIPLIFEIRDLWPESAIDTGVLTNNKVIKMLYRLEKDSYNAANWINVLTPAFEKALIEKKNIRPERISMIPNGADLDIIKPGPKDNWVRRDYNLQDKFIVTYVGAHGVANALMQLVESARILAEKDTQVHLVLVGDGMKKAELIESAEAYGLTNITFVDPVSKNKIADFLNASDACTAVLKKCDTFKTVYPNKVFDYMTVEKPIILGIDGVARELVEQAKAGVYVEPENPQAFAEAVLKLKNNPELIQDLTQKSRQYVSDNFSRETLAIKYLDVIEKVVSSGIRSASN